WYVACQLLRAACVRSSFFLPHTSPPELYTLSLHDALPICVVGQFAVALVLEPVGRIAAVHNAGLRGRGFRRQRRHAREASIVDRSEEHTSELQSLRHLVCRLLLEKKN